MIRLRPIGESDFQTVLDIFVEAFSPSPVPPIEYIANLCHTEPEGCLLAERDGVPVGYAAAHRSGSIGYIGTVAVRNAHRGHGYGKLLTEAVRDYLQTRCRVVGLAVDPKSSRNLNLYQSCGFVPTLPGCQAYKKRNADDPKSAVPSSVTTARQLGGKIEAAFAAIGEWSSEVFPGLDLSRDLQLFATRYPDRLWIDWDGDQPRGFLAYEDRFRGDPWGAIRPGPGDDDSLRALIDALEGSVDEEVLFFHHHTAFHRLSGILAGRGYRVASHNTCMVVAESAERWPTRSDALFLRPWWT